MGFRSAWRCYFWKASGYLVAEGSLASFPEGYDRDCSQGCVFGRVARLLLGCLPLQQLLGGESEGDADREAEEGADEDVFPVAAVFVRFLEPQDGFGSDKETRCGELPAVDENEQEDSLEVPDVASGSIEPAIGVQDGGVGFEHARESFGDEEAGDEGVGYQSGKDDEGLQV